MERILLYTSRHIWERRPIHLSEIILVGDLVLGSEIGKKAFGYGGFGVNIGVGFVRLITFSDPHLPGFGFTHFRGRRVFSDGFDVDFGDRGSNGIGNVMCEGSGDGVIDESDGFFGGSGGLLLFTDVDGDNVVVRRMEGCLGCLFDGWSRLGH